jgi:hypothetical protein
MEARSLKLTRGIFPSHVEMGNDSCAEEVHDTLAVFWTQCLSEFHDPWEFYIEALELFVSVADLCCQVYDSLSQVAE